MAGNFYVPMWLPLNEPLPKDCVRLGCKGEYIYCEQCGEKIRRITHNAESPFSPAEDFSHLIGRVTYEHNCLRSRP